LTLELNTPFKGNIFKLLSNAIQYMFYYNITYYILYSMPYTL